MVQAAGHCGGVEASDQTPSPNWQPDPRFRVVNINRHVIDTSSTPKGQELGQEEYGGGHRHIGLVIASYDCNITSSHSRNRFIISHINPSQPYSKLCSLSNPSSWFPNDNVSREKMPGPLQYQSSKNEKSNQAHFPTRCTLK